MAKWIRPAEATTPPPLPWTIREFHKDGSVKDLVARETNFDSVKRSARAQLNRDFKKDGALDRVQVLDPEGNAVWNIAATDHGADLNRDDGIRLA